MNRTARMAGLGLVAMTAVVGGCVSYASYPPVPENTAINNPNSPAMEEVMMAGLRWVTTKYPPDTTVALGANPSHEAARMAINLPRGVKPQVYVRVAEAVGAGARPLTPENQSLPIYHITSLRVRGDQANVWVLRPVVDMGAKPNGEPIYQEVKLWLQGGLRPWHVVSSIEMSPDSTLVPELVYYEPPAPAESRQSAKAEQTYKPQPKAPPPEAPIANAEEPMPPGGDAPPSQPSDVPPTEPPKP
jgi:hypothetical protein